MTVLDVPPFFSFHSNVFKKTLLCMNYLIGLLHSIQYGYYIHTQLQIQQ